MSGRGYSYDAYTSLSLSFIKRCGHSHGTVAISFSYSISVDLPTLNGVGREAVQTWCAFHYVSAPVRHDNNCRPNLGDHDDASLTAYFCKVTTLVVVQRRGTSIFVAHESAFLRLFNPMVE